MTGHAEVLQIHDVLPLQTPRDERSKEKIKTDGRKKGKETRMDNLMKKDEVGQ